MKILFDNNGFACLAQQPDLAESLAKLKYFSRTSGVEVVGSCTLLQELSGLAHGLADGKVQLYATTLLHYREVTQGRILRLTNDVLVEEGEQLKPLSFDDCLLDEKTVQKLFQGLSEPTMAETIFSEVGSFKANYGKTMEKNTSEILNLPEFQCASPKDVVKGYQEWFGNFDSNIQDWFVHLFEVENSFDVRYLPHVSALLGYALTRIYERFTFGKKNRDNDLLDRSYFVDAAVVDLLVTNDGQFTQTALRVPNRRFEIINTKELCALIDKLDRRYGLGGR